MWDNYRQLLGMVFEDDANRGASVPLFVLSTNFPKQAAELAGSTENVKEGAWADFGRRPYSG